MLSCDTPSVDDSEYIERLKELFHLLPRPVNILRVKDANHRAMPPWSPESLRDLSSWRNSGRFRIPEAMDSQRSDEPVNHTCPARNAKSNNHCLSCVDHGSCAGT